MCFIRNLFFGCTLLASLSTYGQEPCEFLDVMDSTEIYKDKRNVPKKLSKLYWKRYEFKIKIANPNEEWNCTDLLSKKDNNRQLIFGCKKNKNKGFVLINSGGSTLFTSCIFYDIKSGYVESISLDRAVSSMTELKEAISQHLGCYN